MRNVAIRIERIKLVKEKLGICYLDMIEVRYRIEEEGKRTKKRKTRYILRDLAEEEEEILDILNDKERLIEIIEKRVEDEVKREIIEKEYQRGIKIARKRINKKGGILSDKDRGDRQNSDKTE